MNDTNGPWTTGAKPTPDAARWRGCAFGLCIAASHELEVLHACSAKKHPNPTSWTRVTDRKGLSREWRGGEGKSTRLLDYRFPDGRPMMSIDTDDHRSYLVEASGYGAHVVAAGGTRITSMLARNAGWNWQRLLVAQVLPLAATMQGLELVHASAVRFDGRAVAFTAPSGTGKSSIATHLVAAGATLITDDVLAFELSPSRLLAYPGPRLLSVHRHELEAIQVGHRRLGAPLGEDEKVYFRPRVESHAQLLAALYRLTREPAGGSFRIVEEVAPSPPGLLASGFLHYLLTPDRLRRHLELTSRLALTVPVFGVYIPAGLSAARAATLLERHVRDEVPSRA